MSQYVQIKLSDEDHALVEQWTGQTGRTIEAEIERLVGIGLMFDPPAGGGNTVSGSSMASK